MHAEYVLNITVHFKVICIIINLAAEYSLSTQMV